MFDKVGGIPAHPLLVHAAVVLIPLLIIGAILHAVWPRMRGRLGWLVALLAVAAPLAAFVAKLSGQELRDDLIAKGYSPEILAMVDEHYGYGDLTLWYTLALGAVTLVHLYLAGQFAPALRAPETLPAAVRWVLVAAIVVLGVIASYYVFKTGDTGAKAVWTGV